MGKEGVLAPGTVVAGKYRVERELGTGGMGVVLAVRHTQLDELYALKLMLPAAAASAAARERFAREAKAAAKLKSEHVARALDFGFVDEDGPPYMVLELLQGQNLAERLAAKGPLDPRHVSAWIVQACEALREAHAEGIVHRDLKPSNLFLTQRPNGTDCLKVLDFGIAKTVAAESGALTKTATTIGSPFYMSPEQMRSAKNVDARSDVWSLGVTMYELTTGRLPFTGESVTEVAINVIECAVPMPRTFRDDLPDEFEKIVMRCLQKNPARRYASVDYLAAALAAFADVPWTRPADLVEEPPEPEAPPLDPLANTEPAPLSGGMTIPGSPAMTLLGASSLAAVPAPSRVRWLIPIGAAAGIGVVALTAFALTQGTAPTQSAAQLSSAPPDVAPTVSTQPEPAQTVDLASKASADPAEAEAPATSYGYDTSVPTKRPATTNVRRQTKSRSTPSREKASPNKAPPKKSVPSKPEAQK